MTGQPSLAKRTAPGVALAGCTRSGPVYKTISCQSWPHISIGARRPHPASACAGRALPWPQAADHAWLASALAVVCGQAAGATPAISR